MVAISFQPPMAAIAILTCCPNSHPFQERKLLLDANNKSAVKIGRSVARIKANASNGIFDCKVLSRNHALIWYAEGKFYLKDTKSSNGTFVNNRRLSKTSEESPPHELCSGDVVQFGVDVIETTNQNLNVTHGCIIANLKLILPCGKEAKASQSALGPNVPLEELNELNICIQEALQRETLLKNKLNQLQQLVIGLKKATDLSWKALIQEDRLLSRVELLESQLASYSKTFTDDKLHEEIKLLHKDRGKYESELKEILKNLLAEKDDALQKFEDAQRLLSNGEKEKCILQDLLEREKKEVAYFITEYQSEVAKNATLKGTIDQLLDNNKEKVLALQKLQLELVSTQEQLMSTQEQLEKSPTKENLLSDKIQHYDNSILKVREKIGFMRDTLTQDKETDHKVIINCLDEINDILTSFTSRLVDPTSDINIRIDALNEANVDQSKMRSIEDMDKFSKELVEKLEILKDEQKIQEESIQKTKATICYLEESRDIHLDRICSLKSKLDQIRGNLFPEKIDTLDIIIDEKTNTDEKDVPFSNDALDVKTEGENIRKKIEQIDAELQQSNEDLCIKIDILSHTEQEILHIKEQLATLKKIMKNVMNSHQIESKDAVQNKLNEAVDKINLYKVENDLLNSELDMLKNKIKTTDEKDKEIDYLKDECEKLKNILKNYETIDLPMYKIEYRDNNTFDSETLQRKSVNKNVKNEQMTDNVEQNKQCTEIITKPWEPREEDLNISGDSDNDVVIDHTIDINNDEHNQITNDNVFIRNNSKNINENQENSKKDNDKLDEKDDDFIFQRNYNVNVAQFETQHDNENSIKKQFENQIQYSNIIETNVNDDSDDDTSSDETDSSTLIRIKKPKPIVQNIDIEKKTISTQTFLEDLESSFHSLISNESGMLLNDSFTSFIKDTSNETDYFETFIDNLDNSFNNNVKDLSTTHLLGFILLFLFLIITFIYYFENIISQLTATYEPPL